MKTISVPRSGRSLFSTLLVLGGLGALYYYYQRGGKTGDLINRASGKINQARNYMKKSDNKMESSRVSPEVSTSNVDLDRFPAT